MAGLRTLGSCIFENGKVRICVDVLAKHYFESSNQAHSVGVRVFIGTLYSTVLPSILISNSLQSRLVVFPRHPPNHESYVTWPPTLAQFTYHVVRTFGYSFELRPRSTKIASSPTPPLASCPLQWFDECVYPSSA
jgi:hypothetical protein